MGVSVSHRIYTDVSVTLLGGLRHSCPAGAMRRDNDATIVLRRQFQPGINNYWHWFLAAHEIIVVGAFEIYDAGL